MTIPSHKKTSGNHRSRGFSWRRWLATLVVAVLLAALLRGFVVQNYSIPSGSMEPTLDVGDQILVWRPAYMGAQPKRGDVVVFDGRGTFLPQEPVPTGLAAVGSEIGSWFGATNRDAYIVKRVIGVGGDHVVCCGADGRLSVNGQEIDEPYVMPGDAPSVDHFNVMVPAGRLWLMGDHRGDSADSRAHLGDPGGGMVPVRRVVGKVTAVAWPPARFGTVKGREPAGAATPPRSAPATTPRLRATTNPRRIGG